MSERTGSRTSMSTKSGVPANKRMQQTKGAWSGRFAADHREAPFAADPQCSTDLSDR